MGDTIAEVHATLRKVKAERKRRERKARTNGSPFGEFRRKRTEPCRGGRSKLDASEMKTVLTFCSKGCGKIGYRRKDAKSEYICAACRSRGGNPNLKRRHKSDVLALCVARCGTARYRSRHIKSDYMCMACRRKGRRPRHAAKSSSWTKAWTKKTCVECDGTAKIQLENSMIPCDKCRRRGYVLVPSEFKKLQMMSEKRFGKVKILDWGDAR